MIVDNHATCNDRRLLLQRFLVVSGVPVVYGAFSLETALGDVSLGSLVEADLAKEFMARAQEMKQRAIDAGDQPYGAVVAKSNKIVGEGPSRVVTNQDPTAHAEIEAIRDASRRLGTRDLSGCVMFGTSRPCRMCETAAYWAAVSQFVYGLGLVDGGAPTYTSC